MIGTVTLPSPGRVAAMLMVPPGSIRLNTSALASIASICGEPDLRATAPIGMIRMTLCPAAIETCFEVSEATFNESSLAVDLDSADQDRQTAAGCWPMTATYTTFVPRLYDFPLLDDADGPDYRTDPAGYSSPDATQRFIAPLLPPCSRGKQTADLLRFALSEEASDVLVRPLGLGVLPRRARAAADRSLSLDLVCGD